MLYCGGYNLRLVMEKKSKFLLLPEHRTRKTESIGSLAVQCLERMRAPKDKK